MRRLAVLGALAAALLAGCDAPTVPFRADGYEFRLATNPPLVLRWQAGDEVRVWVAPDPPERAALLREAFQEGAGVWNRAVLYGEYGLSAAPDPASAHVLLLWSDSEAPVDLSTCPPGGGRALTTFCLPGEGEAPAPGCPPGELCLVRYPLLTDLARTSPVRMIVTIRGDEAEDPATVRRFVAHELGHVLGIARHSPDVGDLMAGLPLVDGLSERDRNTVQVLYHTARDVIP